ncbi:hypothetical protein EAE99_008254 [Botrytis elliptica]|nr:hypothetical protein EAE99_008254 [Botrytis elliptica]
MYRPTRTLNNSLDFSGDPTEEPLTFQPLTGLNPTMPLASTLTTLVRATTWTSPVLRDISNRFPDFRSPNFMKVIEIYKELLATCPDAGAAGHVFEWHTGISELSPANWAFATVSLVPWSKKPRHVLDFENKAISAMSDGHAEEDWGCCANCNRTDPIQR